MKYEHNVIVSTKFNLNLKRSSKDKMIKKKQCQMKCENINSKQ